MNRQTLADVLQSTNQTGSYTLATVLEGAEAGSQLLLRDGDALWQTQSAELLQRQLAVLQACTATGFLTLEGQRVFAERFGAVPQLVVCGGGHVAAALVKQAKLLGIPVLAIDDREEFAQQLRAAGADGFVIGALTPAGDLDLPAMRVLLDACGGAPVTLHRCIDVSRDLCGTYRAAAALGIDTVLTSGGAESCRKGTAQLAALLRLRDALNGPEILIGAGVSAAVIDELRAALPGARAFHASCKKLLDSGMTFRREGVPMGLPGLDEWHIQQTDAEAVRAAKDAVMR